MPFLRHLFLLAGILIAGNLSAKPVTFTSSKDGFSFEMPLGWKQIPNDVIVQASAEITKSVQNSPHFQPDYAFQSAESADAFTYPYILILIKHHRRPTENELRKAANASVTEPIKNVSKKLSKYMTGASSSQPIFDEETKYTWQYLNADGPIGPLSAIMVVIPTSFGTIQIQGYSKEKDFKEFIPQFAAVIDSFKLSEAYRY